MILNPRNVARCLNILANNNMKVVQGINSLSSYRLANGKTSNFSFARAFTEQNNPPPSPEESKLKSILAKTFPSAGSIMVEDISGGCGSMFQIYVESLEFKGLSTVEQHQLITKALAKEIKSMHGLRITTKIPVV